jgi:serine/threonine protein kinase
MQQSRRAARRRQVYTPQMTTRWYRAPEILYGAHDYGPAIDVWAAGCVVAEAFRNAPVFSSPGDIMQLAEVCATLGTPTPETWPVRGRMCLHGGSFSVLSPSLFSTCPLPFLFALSVFLAGYGPAPRLRQDPDPSVSG